MNQAQPQPKALHWYTLRWQMVIVLCIGFVAAWYMLLGRFHHSVGTGSAGPTIALDAFQHSWSTRKMIIVGLGDSVTAGYGATAKHDYLSLLVANADTEYPDMKGRDLRHVYPQLQVKNYSVSFTTSEQHLKEQIPLLTRIPADVRTIVVMTTGGNDLIHDYGRSSPRDGAMYGCTYEQAKLWGENFRARLKGILDGIITNSPGGCEIFLANIFDPTDGVGDIQHGALLLPAWPDGAKVLPLFNQIISDECRSHPHVHLVDIHALLLGHGIHCGDRNNKYYCKEDPHYWYFTNLEDPNDRGYDAIRRAFLIEMSKVLPRLP